MNHLKKKKTKSVAGDIHFNTATGNVEVHNGAQFQPMTSSVAATAYDRMAQFAMTGTSTMGAHEGPTKEEKQIEVASRMENFLADHIDMDKDAMRKFALDLVKEFDSVREEYAKELPPTITLKEYGTTTAVPYTVTTGINSTNYISNNSVSYSSTSMPSTWTVSAEL